MNKQIEILLSIGISSLLLVGYNGVANKSNNTEKVMANIEVENRINPAKANIEIKEIKLEEDNDYIKSTLSFPLINGLENKTNEKKLNTMFENRAIDLKNSLEKDAKLQYDDLKKNPIFPFRKYEVMTNYTVTYNKNDILSIKAQYYQYSGGAHGGTNQVGYNIDLKTGQLLLLSDIFEEGFDYKNIIGNEILASISKNNDYGINDPNEAVKGIDEKRPFYIEEGNIVIYYGQYEIAPYAAGIPQFKIPFTKLKIKPELGIIK
jgi:hypothetical protein